MQASGRRHREPGSPLSTRATTLSSSPQKPGCCLVAHSDLATLLLSNSPLYFMLWRCWNAGVLGLKPVACASVCSWSQAAPSHVSEEL